MEQYTIFIADCIDGEVRLVDGEFEWEGRLEVCLSQRWSTVSNDGWTHVNSQVVCNALGYDFTGMVTHFSMDIISHDFSFLSFTDQLVNHTVPQALSKPVYIHNIVCSSRDLTLLECGFSRYSGNINDVQDAIVACQKCKSIHVCVLNKL